MQIDINSSALEIPILFLVFNRIDTTIQVFSAIKEAKPVKLYVASDGARESKLDEIEKVNEVRNFILSNIDWECDVKILFRDKNLGCKVAVSNAISWFFENEEMGIILEDDCLPMNSFFKFCSELLIKYKEDNRIMMISGTNYLLDMREEISDSYFFSRHFSIWGWATWRRAWATYDADLNECDDSLIGEANYLYLCLNRNTSYFYLNILKEIKNKKIDTWDLQWVFNCVYNYGLSVTPVVNLISNIGVEGAHAKNITENNFLKTSEISFPLKKYNKWIIPNMKYDISVSHRNFKIGKKDRVILFFKKILKFFKLI